MEVKEGERNAHANKSEHYVDARCEETLPAPGLPNTDGGTVGGKQVIEISPWEQEARVGHGDRTMEGRAHENHLRVTSWGQGRRFLGL